MKVMTRDHSPTVLLVWAATLGFIFAIPGAFLAWRWPEPVDLALLCAMGVLGTITQACYIKGMQAGDAAAMAPIDYTRLVFTAAAGFLLFHEIPTRLDHGRRRRRGGLDPVHHLARTAAGPLGEAARRRADRRRCGG